MRDERLEWRYCIQSYNFDSRKEFVGFIKMYQHRIIGKGITCIYCAYKYISKLNDCPMIIAFPDLMIAVEYMYESDIVLHVLPPDFFDKYRNQDVSTDLFDAELYLSYKDKEVENFDYCNVPIKSISVEPFSGAHYRDSMSDELRPEGGDYFLTIRLHLANGKALCICGEDSINDGYMDVWVE